MLEFAKTPPKGWNSWDVYGASVTEEEVKSLNLQKKLKSLCTKKRNNSYKVVEFL